MHPPSPQANSSGRFATKDFSASAKARTFGEDVRALGVTREIGPPAAR